LQDYYNGDQDETGINTSKSNGIQPKPPSRRKSKRVRLDDSFNPRLPVDDSMKASRRVPLDESIAESPRVQLDESISGPSRGVQLDESIDNTVSRSFQLDPLGDMGILKGFRSDVFDQIKSVKFPSEVAQMGDEEVRSGEADLNVDDDMDGASEYIGDETIRPGINHAQKKFDSLDSVTTRNNQKLFLSLFPNRFASCIKRGKDGDWRQTSQFHHLENEEIIEAIWGKSPFLRACMADKTTRLFVVMIEKDSYYRTVEGLGKIRDCLRCIGVNQMKLFVSDETEQWQLFTFFKTAVPSEKISSLLSSWLRRNGIVPGTAGVSLFPGPDPFCFPLQPGFAWINDNGHVIVNRNEVSPEAALALFISDMERTECDAEELMERLEEVLTKSDK
jgi:hypothetical protein